MSTASAVLRHECQAFAEYSLGTYVYCFGGIETLINDGVSSSLKKVPMSTASAVLRHFDCFVANSLSLVPMSTASAVLRH